MSSIQQPCPSCGRTLQLPDTAAGKIARCPACEQTFQVSGAVPTGNPLATPPAAGDASSPQDESPSPYAAGQESGGQPAYGGQPGGGSFNPYAPTSIPSGTSTIGPYTVRDVATDEIVKMTWEIFKDRWGPLLLSTLVILGVSMMGLALYFVVPVAAVAAAGDAGGVVALVAMIAGVPVGIFAMLYMMTGWWRCIIAIAQGHRSPLSEMLPPMSAVGRFIVGAVVLGFVMGFFFTLFGIVGAMAAAGGDPGAVGVILQVVAVLLQITAGFVFQFFLWPWIYMACHGKSTALGAISDAFALAMHNKGTSIILVIVSVVLSILGTLACYVGQFVTTPLTMLMFAVAYLMMTCQPVDDPRQSRGVPPSPLGGS